MPGRIRWDDARAGGRLLRRLPSFLRHPLTFSDARSILAHRLRSRETDFLTFVRRAAYERPDSPYGRLLALAGCEYGDLETLVEAEGVESALQTLLRHGIYLTFASSVVRICEAARAAGIDLRGAQFTLASEPTTAARLALVQRSGAGAQPCYAITDFGIMGYGCLSPSAPDDVHLFHDLNAVIQADAATPALPADSLLVTSLRPTAPFLLLNVSAGDRALHEARRCGCPLEAAGWGRHLHSIRSFEKLTAGGMTFLDTDLIRVLEDVLPARFGGGPTDYQLVEEDSPAGRPRLLLLVHPHVGPLDENAVLDTFLGGIGSGSGVERVMELAWREAGFLRVARQTPRSTALGKVLHLHIEGRHSALRS